MVGGFGAGSIVCTSAAYNLLRYFRVEPEYLGPASDVTLTTEAGKLFSDAREVVVATATDLASWDGLAEGVYVVGTGDTGLTPTLLTLGLFAANHTSLTLRKGASYFAAMMAAALAFRTPSASPIVQDQSGDNATVTTHNVSPSSAMSTPQFWLTYAALGLANTG